MKKYLPRYASSDQQIITEMGLQPLEFVQNYSNSVKEFFTFAVSESMRLTFDNCQFNGVGF